ncbi:MAG: glycine zipper 2TM domain-containing protein [Burkholderiales bacterium]|nr:glycine zipper 2TM domain-containing protein [Burkholderiales bacterium]
MNWKLKAALGATTVLLATQAAAQITFYEHDGFRGRAFTTERQVQNFANQGFNDLASSVVVDRGNWEVCSDERIGRQCVVLRTGSYQSLSSMGLNDKVSSVRPVNRQTSYRNEAPPPLPQPTYEYRQRANERVYEAPVTSVRAVVGQAEQRCWIERQQVTEQARGDTNVGGAVIGALLGGVLGHQVGGGRGKDVATAGGAVAGALIGGNQGRGDSNTYDKDVQRCRTVASTTPAYWDVTYEYRGIEHRVQMASAPGDTVAVNRNGEPRQ